MSEPGTLEKVALLLGDAFSVLVADFENEGALQVLAELGLSLPPDVVPPSLQSALSTVVTAVSELPDRVADLIDAVEADAEALELVAKAVPIVQACVSAITAFVTVADEIKNVNFADLPGPLLQQFSTTLPKRLLDRTIVRYLSENQRLLTGLLQAVGIVRRVDANPGSDDYYLPETSVVEIDLGRISELFSSPETVVDDLFGWNTNAFDGNAAVDLLYELLSFIGLPVASGVIKGPPDRKFLEFFVASLSPTDPNDPTIPKQGLELLLKFAMAKGIDLAVPVADGYRLNLSATGAFAASTGVRLLPPATISVVPPQGSVQGSIGAGFDKVPKAGADRVEILGVAGGTSLSVQRLGFGLSSGFSWDVVKSSASGDFGIEGRLAGGRLVVSMAGADGFLAEILEGFGIDATFDIGFGWRAGSGVYFTGSGGLVVAVPTHISIGPVEISEIELDIGIDGTGFPISLGVTIGAALGPVAAVVEGIGATATLSFPAGGQGNLGPVNLDVAFKPPKGVGLSIDVGVLKGGGYLYIDTVRGEYAGALEFVLAEFLSINAIGLITTRNPDGSDGFSLLIVLTVEFPGGLHLGYGFTLLGVGGIVGLNRSMNLQALADGVRSGAIESVMFPHDVVKNAPRILSDLRTFFPGREGTFLIGPMVKIGWGTPTLVSVSMGVIIEIPGNIAIVGVLKVVLPTEEADLLRLQVNFIGAIEFDAKRLWFFASLYDSHLLFMTLEGEMGLLVSWGDTPTFVVSVGGFHPKYVAPPLPFPSPKRICVSILDTSVARIRVSNYFAVTSNSVQFGAAAELFFGFSAISIEGHIGFDALITFPPIHFIVEVSASVSLKVFGLGLFSIDLAFTLEGTSPWRAKGRGTLSLLFFDVSADFDETWGDHDATTLDPVALIGLVAGELEKLSSWTTVLPGATSGAAAGVGVILRDGVEAAAADSIVLHPAGELRVNQRALPLDLDVARVGAKKPSDAKRVSVAVSPGAFAKHADVRDQFAMAQYLDLSDAEKVSRPSFEPANSGLALAPVSATAATSRTTRRAVRFEEITIDDRFRRPKPKRFQDMLPSMFSAFLEGSASTKTVFSNGVTSKLDPFGDGVKVAEGSFVVASTIDNTKHGLTAVFGSYAEAAEHTARIIDDDPTLADAVHVVPIHEAVGVR